MARFLHFLIHGRPNEQPRRLRFAGMCALLFAGFASVSFLPWPGGIVTTGVVDYEPMARVRAESPGFVHTLHVRPGQHVRAGTPVVTITDPRSELELSDVEISIRQSKIRSRMLRGEDDYTAIQVETMQQEALNEQRQELIGKVAGLRLSAPMDGCVIGRELDLLKDQYVHLGDEVLAIGSEERKSIIVAVPQQHAESFLQQVGSRPRVRVQGGRRIVHGARLTRVDPRASDHIPHAALAASYGGPLAVVPRSDDDAAGPDEALRLVEPHFRATIGLSPEEASQLNAGQLARVRIRASDESIGAHVWETLDRWVRNKLGGLR